MFLIKKKPGKTNTDIEDICLCIYFTFCKTQFHYKIGPFIWNFALIFADENGFFLSPPSASLEKWSLLWQLVPWEINTVALLGSLFHLYQGTAVELAARAVAFNCD